MARSKGSFQAKSVEIFTPERATYEMRQGRDIRSEYSVLRHRAEQRLRDMAAGGGSHLSIYQDYKNRFPTLTEIGSRKNQDDRLLADAYAEVTRFLNMRQSTIGGYRESVKQAAETFERHYGDELPHMDHDLFGEMMRAIKDSERGKAYYRNWKKTYRALLSNADRAGLSQEDLLDAVRNGEISIGPKGGLLDESAGRYIAGKWAGMGF